MEPQSSGGAFAAADGFVRVLLLGLAFFLPFFFIPVTYVAIPQSKMLLISLVFILAVLVWGFVRIARGSLTVPRSLLVYVSVLLPIAYLASSAYAGWHGRSLIGTGTEQDTLAVIVLMCALLLLTAFSFAGNFVGLKRVVEAFLAGTVVLYTYQALYIFFPTWVSFGLLSGETANIFSSWHDLGILAGLTLFLSVVLWRSGSMGIMRLLPIVLGLLSIFFIVIVHFVDILFASAALFAVAGLMGVYHTFREGHGLVWALKRSLVWFVFAIALGSLGAFGTKLWERLPEPILVVQTEVRPSWQGTFDIARESLQAPSELLFGSGPNSFIREWGLHKPSGVNATPFWDSDFNSGVGIIPTSIFTSGAVGLIAWAAIILVLIGLMFRFAYGRSNSSMRAFAGASLVSAVYLIAYHMIYTPGLALTTATFMALAIAGVASVGDAPSRNISISVDRISGGVKLLLFVVLLLATIFSAGLLTREVVSNIFVNKSAQLYQTSNNSAAAGEALATALLLSSNNDRAHRAAAELGVIQLNELSQRSDAQSQETITQLQATLQTTISHGLAAVSIDDSNYQNWLLLAQIYGNLVGANVEGSYEQAQSAYAKALETNPTNPTPKLRLAQLAMIKGDTAAAKKALDEVVALKPDFAFAHFLLSQVDASLGNGDAAVQSASIAVQLVPQDPLGWFNLGYILYSGQRYTESGQSLLKAVELSPDYSNALFYLGLVFFEVGENDNAIRAFDRVLELNPNETWVRQISENIRAGKKPLEGIGGN